MCAQSEEPVELRKNVVYFDMGIIPGIYALINYECRIHSHDKTTLYARAGLGYAGIIFINGGTGALGAMTLITGKKNGHFELSGGVFVGKSDYGFITNSKNKTFVLHHLKVGFRYQRPEGGIIFKGKLGLLGIGIGHSFLIAI